jgi:acylphosphatase
MRVHLRIHGVVQGVGFRWAAQRQARALGLTGWVRNDVDGSVEGVADGRQEQVAEFIAWCRQGPRGARVHGVDVADSDEAGPYADFSIRP